MSAQIRQKLIKLLRRLGVPLNPNKRSMHYNGNRGDPKYFGTCAHEKNTVEEISHEGAHWLVAAPERRTLVNYGLGPGPENSVRGEDAPLAHEDEIRSLDGVGEELKASLLGILMEAHAGEDPKGTLKMHSWHYGENSDADIDTVWKEIPESLHFWGHKGALKKTRAALRRLIDERKN